MSIPPDAHIEEVRDDSDHLEEQETPAPYHLEDSDSDSDAGNEAEVDGVVEDETPTGSTLPKKKKKKKSKASKLINSLRPQQKAKQAVYDEVMDRIKAEQSADAPVDEAKIKLALDQLKLMEFIQGKSDLSGRNKKDAGDHKFWATQPVPQFTEESSPEDGEIEPSKPRNEVRQEPYPLLKDFEWTTVDMNDPAEVKEVYELLSENYVEHEEASFRLQYSAEFLHWALKPPGYVKEWHVGVRVSRSKKLVAFISGVPITLRVRDNVIRASEINFLCIHKKLRSKRLAPVLIKEVTRQVHLTGIFQAMYTAGVLLPTPVSTCRYYHRSLNVAKLVDVKFAFVPRSMTLARMIRQHKVPSVPRLPDLREMEERDLEAVSDLFSRYMQRYGMLPLMTLDDVRHHFLSGKGEGERQKGVWKGRREKQVVWSYVIENPETHKITDFFSFYSLPSTIMQSPKHKILETAYLYYYATEVAFEDGAEEDGRLAKRLQDLIGDALIVADQAEFDVFNALTMMDNAKFLSELKFQPGDGLLNFYLYNWRTAPLAGVESKGGVPEGMGVGVVML